jgi:4'-phosphopantetheinyl transferase
MDASAFPVQNSMLWLPIPVDPAQDPAPTLTLATGEVHLWQADLAVWSPWMPHLQIYLTADEQTRAARYLFDEHRRRYTIARGLLRLLLSRYTGVAAADLRFTYSVTGKPSLANHPPLEFNLSHSQEIAIYALSERAVGVDVEYLRPVDHLDQLSKRYFSARETELLYTCSGNAQISMFFRLWTAKEAYLKATGEGLSQLYQAHLCLPTPGQLQFEQGWQLLEFNPTPQYQGSLAYAGAPQPIKYWKAEAAGVG